MSDYSRPRITWGNDFTIRIALQQFLNGEYVDFNLSTVKSLEVYLICSTHNQKIPLEWELEPGFDYVISCFVDYRVTHPNTSYGIGVEGIDENDNHFRWYMAGKEGILVVTNTSGQNIPQDVEIVDLSGRVGWGIQTNGDLTNYYTKDETEQYVQGELEDYYDKGETDGLLNNKVDTSTLVNDYYNKNTVDNLLDTKADTSDLNNYYDKTQTDTLLNQKANVSDLNNYYDKTQTDTLLNQKADTSDLNNYYDKGETDGLLNNKVDTSTLVNDYYNKNTVDNLLDAKADTSDLNNYYDKTETNSLLNQKANVSDLNNKQDTLVSGENIKTVNNQSILGSGNIDIQVSQVQSDWTETDTSDPSYIQNKPNLATVATSGDYDDLTNKPTIPAAQVQSNWTETDTSDPSYIQNKPNFATVATSGSYNDLTNTPNLATVATSGDYDDLTNKPTIPAAQVQSDYNQSDNTQVDYIKNKPNLATVATSGDYDDLTNKPNLSQYATQTDLAGKQDTLVSGTNIKTINNQSLLGSGNIDIQGGGGENHDNADEATANALFELNERLSEAEINIDIIPTEVQAKIDELEANVEQSLDELPPKFDEIDEEFKSTALVIEELHETAQPGFVRIGNGLVSYNSTNYNTNIGNNAVIEGYGQTKYTKIESSGNGSHAEGISTKATFTATHAEGQLTKASGDSSHAEGKFTETQNEAEHAEGNYNKSIKTSSTFGDEGNTLSTIGNGNLLRSHKHNAFEVRQNGDIYYSDTEKIDGTTVYYYTAPMRKLQDAMVTSTTNGLKIEVVSALPANPGANTIYIVT